MITAFCVGRNVLQKRKTFFPLGRKKMKRMREHGESYIAQHKFYSSSERLVLFTLHMYIHRHNGFGTKYVDIERYFPMFYKKNTISSAHHHHDYENVSFS